jgi:hypothetical protein
MSGAASGAGSYTPEASGAASYPLSDNAASGYDTIKATPTKTNSSPDGDHPKSQKEELDRDKTASRERILNSYLLAYGRSPGLDVEDGRLAHQDADSGSSRPDKSDIHSGRALNNILTDLRKIEDQGTRGLHLDLDPDMAHHLNFTAGSGTPALLKSAGRLTWPVALAADDFKLERERLNLWLLEAVHQALQSEVNPALLRQMTRSVAKLRDQIGARISDLPPNQFMEANRFLTLLEDGLKLLASPEAGKILTAQLQPGGLVVGDLVSNMIANGLVFAPAMPGDEAAYVVLHGMLTTYWASIRGELASNQ